MGVYEKMAGYYDLIYGEDYDIGLYVNEARKADGPILEIGCGTGRVLLTLMSEGLQVTGIDICKPMLDELRKKAKRLGLEPDVHLADMRDFKLDRKFKLIIIPYRSFSHMMDDGDRKKALKTLKEHLAEGGKLIFDMINPSEYEFGMTDGFHPYDSEEMKTPEGKRYRLEWFLKYEPAGMIAKYRVVITMDGERHEFTMDTTYMMPSRTRRLLEECGYRNIRMYGGSKYENFDEKCAEVFWFAGN